VALLLVTLASGCAVYEKPTLAAHGRAGGGDGFGGSRGGEESGGEESGGEESGGEESGGEESSRSATEPGSFGGRPPSLAVDAGQAGANDSHGDDGGAGSGGAGSGGAGGPGGNGGAAGASDDGGSASAAGSSSCAAGWRNQSTCDQCATQVQVDLQACATILDCYISKGCGPSSCASPDQKCGPNVLREGAAAYEIAQDVFACMCE
jgi:hypothetical protein